MIARPAKVKHLPNHDVIAAHDSALLDTPETQARIRELLIARAGAVRFALIRTVLLFADIKPVRLDPRTTATVLPPVPGGGSIE